MEIVKHIATKDGARAEFLTEQGLTDFLSTNPDYVSAGAVTEQITQTEEVKQPREVPAWKIKYILNLKGLTQSIETLINSLPDPPKTLIRTAWENTTVIDRWSQTVIFLQSQLQWSDEFVNGIFTDAENLPI